MIEIIKHAAVRAKDGQIFLGKSHAECFMAAANIGYTMGSSADSQGFMTNRARFVDRKEAAKIAVEAGQVDLKTIEILFSEDLWSPTANGKFYYDYVKGYVLRGDA